MKGKLAGHWHEVHYGWAERIHSSSPGRIALLSSLFEGCAWLALGCFLSDARGPAGIWSRLREGAWLEASALDSCGDLWRRRSGHVY